YAINGTSICITPSGEKYVQFRVEKFIPTTAFNAATKSQIEVRRRVITYSASGEPYFPEFGIPAVDFEAQFEADGWQGQAEAVEMHRELGPTIERETAARQGEQAAIAERNARAGSRARNADNPQAELASAISAGIATALAELGLAKKGGKI
ncbi:MAG: hypothetical protein NT154_04400, partial [Verrucomicrobia bacterium]|nr:hypothetical protein [Verrucomicrobiota bacterium]